MLVEIKNQFVQSKVKGDGGHLHLEVHLEACVLIHSKFRNVITT